ncbi:Structural maintenance of chromosomes protein 6 [Maudiozyma exigua]|uniref:Structural maintenance of chromosomes protein 6 n=1 Tax=Maudiozyma exigua TaxID=34358 RepID=A0A9P7BDR0_MAUEX|nr:Structural maintenance of chromosomes protein 6 [Kazachstania exigua]
MSSAKRSLQEVDNELLDFAAQNDANIERDKEQAPKRRKRIYEAITQYSMNTQDEAGSNSNLSYPGYIKKVKLRNFMSHENFELELGPQLNFIVGNNGSGKSAILTAITIGLGGKTSDTNRGTKLTDLIREGTASTKITLYLDNRGPGSYDPEKFGDTIIIERTIRRDSSNVFSVKTENGNEVGNKKKDVQLIVDFFSIPIINPMCFLSQDAARRFLTASTSQDKYHHFMKGTLLEDTKINLDNASAIVSKAQENMRLHAGSLQVLKQEYKDSKKLAREFNKTSDLNEKKMLLCAKILSLDIEANTKSSNAVEQEIVNNGNQIKNFGKRIEKRKADIERFVSDQKKAEEGIENQMNIINTRDQDFRAKKDEVAKLRGLYNAEERNQTQTKQSITDCKNRIQLFNKKIAKFEQKINEEMGGDREAMKEQLKTLEKERDVAQGNLSAMQTTLRDLQNREKRECDQRNVEVRSLEDGIAAKTSEYNKIKTGNNDFLLNFDRKINQLFAEIERNKNHFHSMPIGPLGRFVSIKREYNQWTQNIQKFLSSTVSSFLVTDLNDDRLLRRIMKKCNIRNIGVLIYKMKRLDVSSFLVKASYPTIYDAVVFDTPEMESLFIDVTYLEKVVLIENYKEARNFLQGNPGKIRMALSLRDRNSGYQLRGANQLDSVKYESQIKIKVGSSNEDNLAYLKQTIDEEIKEIEKIKNKYETVIFNTRQEMKTTNETMKRLSEDVKRKGHEITQLTVKANAIVDTGLLTSMNEERDKQEGAVAVYEATVKEIDAKLDELREKIQPIKISYDNAKRSLRDANKTLDELKAAVNSRSDKVERYNADIQNCEHEIEKLSQKNKSLEQNKEVLVNGITKQKLSLEQICSIEELQKANLPDKKDELKREIDKISKDIRRAENSIGISEEKVVQLFNESRAKYKDAYNRLESLETTLIQLQQSIKERVIKYNLNVNETFLKANLDFIGSLKMRKLTGKLFFKKEEHSLEIYVSTPGDTTERSVDTLSGGEKSYSQMALLLATWEPMRSRIIALDEFDVYMDQVNRKIGTGLIVNKLKDKVRTQTIIITPQDIGKITDINDSGVMIHRIKDPKRQNNSDNRAI